MQCDKKFYHQRFGEQILTQTKSPIPPLPSKEIPRDIVFIPPIQQRVQRLQVQLDRYSFVYLTTLLPLQVVNFVDFFSYF